MLRIISRLVHQKNKKKIYLTCYKEKWSNIKILKSDVDDKHEILI